MKPAREITHAQLFPSVQGTLALDLAPSARLPQPARARPRCDVIAVSSLERKRLERWAHQFVQAAVEVVSGDRSVGQLARATGTELYAELERRSRLLTQASQRPPGLPRIRSVTGRATVQRVTASFITATTVEATATVKQGSRLRAVAVRFEQVRDRWLATEMNFC